ncbi:DUF5988 family protein [Actinomadura scrupuli]|uniref:DUF5988 family protein n=1 Tax=Actinomadura scrupuli TaxID=559629 RepID=UPI003D965E10
MDEHTRLLSGNGSIDVVLEGGPDNLPRAMRTGRSALTERRLKIRHRNGYEHFELVGESTAATPATFRWIMRTKIAE